VRPARLQVENMAPSETEARAGRARVWGLRWPRAPVWTERVPAAFGVPARVCCLSRTKTVQEGGFNRNKGLRYSFALKALVVLPTCPEPRRATSVPSAGMLAAGWAAPALQLTG